MKLVPRYAAIALLAAISVSCSAGTSGKGATARSSPDLITREMIESSGRNTADELVRMLRPNWLNRRGTQTLTLGPGEVVIYYGSSRLGGPDALRGIEVQSIEFIQFLTSTSATQRFGTNHEHGAIIITPRGTSVTPRR